MVKSKNITISLITALISLIATVRIEAQERDTYAVVIKGAYVLGPEPIMNNMYKITDHLDVRNIVKLNSLAPIPIRNVKTNHVNNYYKITSDWGQACLIRADLIQKLDADYIVPQTGSFKHFYQPRKGEPISTPGSDKMDTWGYFRVNKWNQDGSVNVTVLQHVESEKDVKTIIPSYNFYPEKFGLDKTKLELKSSMVSPMTEYTIEQTPEEIKHKFQIQYFVSYAKEFDAHSEVDEFIDDFTLLREAKLFYAYRCGPREIARYVIQYMLRSCEFDKQGHEKEDIVNHIKAEIRSQSIPASNTLYISKFFTRFDEKKEVFLNMFRISKVIVKPPDSYLVICLQGNCDGSQGNYIEKVYIQRFTFREDIGGSTIDPLIRLFRDELLDIVRDNENIKTDGHTGNKMFLIKGGQGRDYMSKVLNKYLNLTQYDETFRKFMVSTLVKEIFAFEK